jgi:hypothetical protein
LTEKCAIFCVRYSQNYKLTPAPSENCFAIFLLRVRSNKPLNLDVLLVKKSVELKIGEMISIAIIYHFFGNYIYMIVYHFLGHDIDDIIFKKLILPT